MIFYYLNNLNKIILFWCRFVYIDFNLKNGLFVIVYYIVYRFNGCGYCSYLVWFDWGKW